MKCLYCSVGMIITVIFTVIIQSMHGVFTLVTICPEGGGYIRWCRMLCDVIMCNDLTAHT